MKNAESVKIVRTTGAAKVKFNKKRQSGSWVILVGKNQFGTNDPEYRITSNKDRATRFSDYGEALWRSEVIMFENQDKDVRIVKWR
jgi:hypothetical protein